MKWTLVLALCLTQTVLGIQVDILPTSQGIRFEILDEGYSLVGLHYSINSILTGVAAGQVNADLTKEGNKFVYVDNSHVLKPGDTINYWILTVSSTTGEGKDLLDQHYTYTGPTTTPAPTTTTTRPTTAAPAPVVTHDTWEQIHGHPSSTPTTVPPDFSTTTSGGNVVNLGDGTVGTGSGTCSCKGAVTDPYNKESECTTYPCLIFEDDFDALDLKLWEHEITAGGGGNWEFQFYTNNRSNSYVRDSTLYIKPSLTNDQYGPQFIESGHLNLWGSHPADECTGNLFWGCERQGNPAQVINPIQSARLRSSRSFNFKYGRLEVEAKMPTGDWLWPAIWLLPRYNSYGGWPASGEIDLVESRGNLQYKNPSGQSQGVDTMGSTLHFGPFVDANQWPKAHAETTAASGTFGDSFHKYTLDWDETSIRFSVDGAEILKVDPGPGGFWDFGEFEKDGQSKWNNPWAAGTKMAPFDQEFFIIMNVAVGGVGFFPDENINMPYPKPWNDKSGHAATAFWSARNNWLPTWKLDQNNGEDAALQVKYVRVWKMKPTP